MEQVISLGRLINDPTRLRVIKLLLAQPMCVCELMEVLKINQPCVSQHLSILKYHNLLKSKREGKWIIYEVERKVLKAYLKDLEVFIKIPLTRMHVFKKEVKRLTNLKNRGLLYKKLGLKQKRA